MYGSPIPNPCSPILLFQETQPFVIYTFIHYLRTLTKRFFQIHLEFLYSLFFVLCSHSSLKNHTLFQTKIIGNVNTCF